MSELVPPLFGHAPPFACGRILVAGPCGADAEWHVIWSSDIDNGLCCQAHYDEARERWAFYAAHRYEMECSMPGAVFVEAENRCRVDEESLGLYEVMAAEVIPQ
jgi:hypothetical protein